MPLNFERKARRKAQSKLTFDPVAKEEGLSPTGQMSPARVRYQLPTPAQSSQPLGRGNTALASLDATSDDEDLVVFSQRKSRSSPYKVESDNQDFTTHAKKKRQPVKAPGAFRSLSEKTKKKKQKYISLSDSEDNEDEDEDLLALVNPATKRRTRFKIEDSDSDSDSKDLQAGGLSTKMGTLAVPDEDDDEDKSPVPTSVRRCSRPVPFLSDDEDDEALLLPKPRRPTMKGKQFIELSDEDDSPVISSPSKRRRSVARTDHYGNDEPLISSPSKRIKVDDDSDIALSPTGRSECDLTGGDEESENDNENESENESESKMDVPRGRARLIGTRSRVTRQTKSPKKHRTAKQKAAELLRRKRAGEKIDALTESSSGDESNAPLYDSDQELLALAFFEDEEPSPENTSEVAVPAPRRHVSNNNTVDDDEEDFIVNDGDHPLGVPEMPLQFSRAAHKPLKENFADCVEWIIHSNIDPDFPDRKEERYSHAYHKVDDEAQGYAISSFISSQWTSEFTAAIRNRPILTMRNVEDGEGLTPDGVLKCDACNHKNHPPKYALSFRGEPYKKKTLEDVEQDSDYERGDEDAMPVDEVGNDLQPAGREWFSGRDCSDKAFQGHKLIHWRYSLNQAVIEMLEEARHFTTRKIAKREAATADERWVYADEIFQAWKDDGTIAGLYREFKKMMETARAYEPRRYGR